MATGDPNSAPAVEILFNLEKQPYANSARNRTVQAWAAWTRATMGEPKEALEWLESNETGLGYRPLVDEVKTQLMTEIPPI